MEVPESYVEQAITEVVMHEVGHTLGLRHNFKGSAAYSHDQLADGRFVAEHGFGASVMDYNPAYLPSDPSRRHADQHYSSVVGAYDKHAIQYGYMHVEGERGGVQAAPLAALAAEGAARRELAFATDEDEPRSDGADPFTNVYDLSDDPIAFHEDRLALAQSLLLDAANKSVLPGEAWTRQLAVVKAFMRTAASAGAYCAKCCDPPPTPSRTTLSRRASHAARPGGRYLGGFVFRKAHKRDPGAAESVVPVEAAEQRRALALVLSVVAQDFWLPAASALRRMPKRTGWCDGIDQYCLGLGAPDLLTAVQKTRSALLLGLLQPAPREPTQPESPAARSHPLAPWIRQARLAGLAQHEWEDLPAAAVQPGAARASYAAWLQPPAPLPLADFAAATPSVESMLRAVDRTVAVPERLLRGGGEPNESATAQKMRYEMQRVWVAALAALSAEDLGEGAAVASALLRDRQRELASISLAALASESLRAHLEALAHMLSLWERGQPVLPEAE
jgi:hypothetical protein